MDQANRCYPGGQKRTSWRYPDVRSLDNLAIAAGLDRVADLMELEPELTFRVAAYRDAAHRVRAATRPLVELVEREGVEGVHALGLGYLLAGRLVDWLTTGDFALLRRLEHAHSPTDALERVPGIGARLARQLTAIGITGLEELRQALLDGRLRKVCGFGPRRIELVQGTLDLLAPRRHRTDERQLDLGIDAA